MTNTSPPRTQWHPVFSRILQIELEQDADNLEFQEEYCVRKLPSRMDILITMRNPNLPVKKNIGQIFTRYNLLEFKPQGDYLSINDYAYIMGNAYLMKTSGKYPSSISENEISITLIGFGYPCKLMNHLKRQSHIQITEAFPRIYHISGERFPVQIISTQRLHKNNHFYEEAMSFIATINKNEFRRRTDMCKGLMEIIRPEIEKEKLDAIEKAKPQIIEQAEQKKCLEIARQLKECLDIQTISQKLGLPLEVVQNL